MSKVNSELQKEIRLLGEFNAQACMNCGTCTAVCPLGLKELPRELFRHVVLGLDEEIENKIETIFTCLLCRMCEANCPAGVKISENVRTLRNYVNQKIYKV